MIRQWGNLGSMAAMMVLPWALLEASDTPVIYAILWDVFLGLHLISCWFQNATPSRPPICSLTGSATRGSVFDWPNANQNGVSCSCATDGVRSGRFHSAAIRSRLV